MNTQNRIYQPPEFAGDIKLQLSRNESRPSIDVAHRRPNDDGDGVTIPIRARLQRGSGSLSTRTRTGSSFQRGEIRRSNA